MTAWTPLTPHAAGEYISLSDWNNAVGNLNFLYERAYAIAYNSSSASVPTGGTKQVPLTASAPGVVNYGATVSANNVVVPFDGLYQVLFAVNFTSAAGSGSNAVYSAVYQNGNQVILGSEVPSYVQGGATTNGSGLIACSANDTIGLYASNLSGSTLYTNNAFTATFLHVNFMGAN